MKTYSVYVSPSALREIQKLPGHVRQRVKRFVREFSKNPRPPGSKALDFPISGYDLLRIRLGNWRLVYGISDADRAVDILAVRMRPPYAYDDLARLLENE